MADDDVNVKFGADTGEATGAITELREVLRGFSAPIQGIRQNLGELAEAFAAAFAVEKVSEFFEKMAELGDETERTSAMLGISTEEVGKLNAISQLTGTSTGTMTTTLERLSLSLQRAKEGTGPAAAALTALGMSAKQFNGLPTEQVLDKIADKFAGMQDGMNKTAIAMALLGRGGAQLIPVLDLGSKGMDELGEAGVRAGTTLSAGTVDVLTKMHEAFVELGLSLQGIGVSLANSFGPAATAIAGALSDLFEWINNTTKAGGIFKDLLELLVIVAKGVASAILEIVLSIEVLVQSADLAMSEVIDMLSGNLGKAKTDFETFQASVLASSTQWMTRMQALWGQATTAPAATKKAAPSMDLNQSGANSAAKEIDAEIKVLELGLQQKKSLLDQEVAQHKISQQQKFQSLQDYTDDAYEDERALLEKEMALYGSGTTQYAAVKAKMLELDAKYALDSQKITTDAVKAQTKSYTDFFNTIEGAFNSQLKGLLAGTTSWSQAFKNILGDLVIKFIEYVEKMSFEWVAGELAKTAATTAGVTARTTAEVAGSTVSSAANFASIFKSIMASAQQTFAGIFGFLSPVMGPAAAAPAVAGEATVAAAAAAVPSLDVGTPWVASSGLAMIHAGEAVVPASVNGAWQDGAGANPISVHLHLDGGVNDGASLARFWKDNARNIANAVAGHVSLNPSAAR